MLVKIALITLLIGIGFFLVTEIGLRSLLGLGNPLIYQPDETIGYLLVPNQQVWRSGNRIAINAYSMRGPDVSEQRSQQVLRVLLLGDSIANGGWWTDQDQIMSSLIQNRLQRVIDSKAIAPLVPFEQVEVLNASANSWGPRNQFAYLQRFGTFEAQRVLLLLNTDDLFATAPTSLPVGRDMNYPDRKPLLAWTELLKRYLSPPPSKLQTSKEAGDRVGANLAAIQQMNLLVEQHQGRLLVAMTPLLREVSDAGSREYELRARQRLTELTQIEQMPLLDFLPIFQTTPQPEVLYRDSIHLSQRGDEWVSQKLAEWIQQSYD
jgi:hypothetical protein